MRAVGRRRRCRLFRSAALALLLASLTVVAAVAALEPSEAAEWIGRDVDSAAYERELYVTRGQEPPAAPLNDDNHGSGDSDGDDGDGDSNAPPHGAVADDAATLASNYRAENSGFDETDADSVPSYAYATAIGPQTSRDVFAACALAHSLRSSVYGGADDLAEDADIALVALVRDARALPPHQRARLEHCGYAVADAARGPAGAPATTPLPHRFLPLAAWSLTAFASVVYMEPHSLALSSSVGELLHCGCFCASIRRGEYASVGVFGLRPSARVFAHMTRALRDDVPVDMPEAAASLAGFLNAYFRDLLKAPYFPRRTPAERLDAAGEHPCADRAACDEPALLTSGPRDSDSGCLRRLPIGYAGDAVFHGVFGNTRALHFESPLLPHAWWSRLVIGNRAARRAMASAADGARRAYALPGAWDIDGVAVGTARCAVLVLAAAALATNPDAVEIPRATRDRRQRRCRRCGGRTASRFGTISAGSAVSGKARLCGDTEGADDGRRTEHTAPAAGESVRLPDEDGSDKGGASGAGHSCSVNDAPACSNDDNSGDDDGDGGGDSDHNGDYEYGDDDGDNVDHGSASDNADQTRCATASSVTRETDSVHSSGRQDVYSDRMRLARVRGANDTARQAPSHLGCVAAGALAGALASLAAPALALQAVPRRAGATHGILCCAALTTAFYWAMVRITWYRCAGRRRGQQYRSRMPRRIARVISNVGKLGGMPSPPPSSPLLPPPSSSAGVLAGAPDGGGANGARRADRRRSTVGANGAGVGSWRSSRDDGAVEDDGRNHTSLSPTWRRWQRRQRSTMTACAANSGSRGVLPARWRRTRGGTGRASASHKIARRIAVRLGELAHGLRRVGAQCHKRARPPAAAVALFAWCCVFPQLPILISRNMLVVLLIAAALALVHAVASAAALTIAIDAALAVSGPMAGGVLRDDGRAERPVGATLPATSAA